MLIESFEYDRIEYYRLEGFYELGSIVKDGQSGVIFSDREDECNTIWGAKSVQDKDVKVMCIQYPSHAEWIGFTITLRLLRQEESGQ